MDRASPTVYRGRFATSKAQISPFFSGNCPCTVGHRRGQVLS